MIKRRLIILGGGDFARELLWMASDIPEEERDWSLFGVLDDSPEAAAQRLQSSGVGLPVLGSIREYQPAMDDAFLCAIGSPKAKLEVCELIRERGGEFITFVAKSVARAASAQIGAGSILCHFARVSVDVTVGEFVTINVFSSIGHDAVLEDGCTISGHCDVTGHAHLERGVFLGSHASVLPSVRVGEFATVGAGSVAARRVQANQTVVGVPAKVLW